MMNNVNLSRQGPQSRRKLSFSSMKKMLVAGIVVLLILYIFMATLLVTKKSSGSPSWGKNITRRGTSATNSTTRVMPSNSNGDGRKPSRRGNQASAKKPPRQQKRGKTDKKILTAYLEPINRTTWDIKPLPARNVTANDLTRIFYPKLNSCSKLPEQWPVDDYDNTDPFLPWIHDVFPSHDGKFIQFVAQNKRRCHFGNETQEEERLLLDLAPQVSLFQHVPVQRIHVESHDKEKEEVRYRLASHALADRDGGTTRFICRFSNGEETLSIFNLSYEWAARRRRLKAMFHENGRGGENNNALTSQLLFKCPVPPSLVETIRTGSSVKDDYATMFVDLVPIRTPPRYGRPEDFLPPYYGGFESKKPFDPALEWGESHILPKLSDSGRWENIPICKPTLLTYGENNPQVNTTTKRATPIITSGEGSKPVKQHRLVACLWASAGYETRGGRFAINDGPRRLLEWITHHANVGVEHFYLYDNSAAYSSDNNTMSSLESVANLFPNHVTRIPWPCKICHNGEGFLAERSSQYAAEASCRLRFGPHTDWIAQFDIDEYLIPMGETRSVPSLLDKLDKEGTKVVSFESSRAWARREFIEDPNLTRLYGREYCGFKKQYCFQLRIPMNVTLLQAFNCDKTIPGEKREEPDPAEKQLYRADYVHHHFIHYTLVTETSALNKKDTVKLGLPWSYKPDDHFSRYVNESSEALMLHAKAIAPHETNNWEKACLGSFKGKYACRLGVPFPENISADVIADEMGLKYNCYVNGKIENHWLKLMEKGLEELKKSTKAAQIQHVFPSLGQS